MTSSDSAQCGVPEPNVLIPQSRAGLQVTKAGAADGAQMCLFDGFVSALSRGSMQLQSRFHTRICESCEAQFLFLIDKESSVHDCTGFGCLETLFL